jgi:hypothetical protein
VKGHGVGGSSPPSRRYCDGVALLFVFVVVVAAEAPLVAAVAITAFLPARAVATKGRHRCAIRSYSDDVYC